MAGVNKAILIGNLGRDPELRYTQSGQAVVNFSIATSENWTDKNGERQERTEWHRIVVWGKTGENCARFLSKGRTVYVEGRIQTREWEDREGQKRTTTEINAQTVTFLGSAGAGRGSEPADPTPPESSPPESSPDSGAGPPPPDDVPF
jgi:single-strand DNA-binding protein